MHAAARDGTESAGGGAGAGGRCGGVWSPCLPPAPYFHAPPSAAAVPYLSTYQNSSISLRSSGV